MKFFWVWEWNNTDYISNELTDIENSKIEYNEENWQVAVDIIENPAEVIIVSPIAGVELEEIDVSLKDWVLVISWDRKKPIELYLHWSILRVWEVFWWPFSRTIILPENLDLDNIKAILEKGILIIKIPKLKFSGQSINIEKIDD
jgi:HSP20 family protein